MQYHYSLFTILFNCSLSSNHYMVAYLVLMRNGKYSLLYGILFAIYIRKLELPYKLP